MANEWNRLGNPPPPLFTGKKEQDFTKQVSTELVERVVGQQVLYYPLDIEKTNYHPLYGEAMEKNYLPPVHVYCRVSWEGFTTTTDTSGIDRTSRITVHFHSRRLTEDQNLEVKEGDVIMYGDDYYEISEINMNEEIFGQSQYKDQIEAKCHKVTDEFFAG